MTSPTDPFLKNHELVRAYSIDKIKLEFQLGDLQASYMHHVIFFATLSSAFHFPYVCLTEEDK